MITAKAIGYTSTSVRRLAMSEDKYTTIECDLPDDEESRKSIMAMGFRLAILQGIYDITYTEIAECLEDNFSQRRVNPD